MSQRNSHNKKSTRSVADWGHHSEYVESKRYKSANKKKTRQNASSKNLREE